MRRDAFTLIELLIVIGILVGIVGATLLSLTDFRRESELRAVADRLESIGALARAEALRHGEPVELILRASTDSRSGTPRPMRVLTRRLDPVGSASDEAGGRDASRVSPARARTELPKWLSVADEVRGQPIRARGESADHRLAVFMADGSALGGQSVTLEDGRSGARVTIEIDALTGGCAATIDWNPKPDDGLDEDDDSAQPAPERAS